MGKPGAIALMGVGIFILVLGWQGRLSAVWDIMKGEIPTPDLPSPGDIIKPPEREPIPQEPEIPDQQDGPPSAVKCGNGQQKILLREANVWRCILAQDIAGVEPGNTCRNGWLLGTRDGDGFNVCVRSVRAAGEAFAHDYSWTVQPTGASVKRYQPNVRATD